MTPILTFDIATVPDVVGLRRLQGLDSQVSDHEVAEMAFQLRRQQTGQDALPLHLQRVVAIACTLRAGSHCKVWSLGGEADSEASLIQRFFDGIEKYSPQLVSWSGSALALPVLHYRGLLHGVHCPRYWEQGENDREFQRNNYLSPQHTRHLDLQEVLARYHAPAQVPADELARLLGLPGAADLSDSQRWQAWQNGQLADIRQQTEIQALNLYLLFARFQQLRGHLSPEGWQQETALVRNALAQANQPHLNTYLAAWTEHAPATNTAQA